MEEFRSLEIFLTLPCEQFPPERTATTAAAAAAKFFCRLVRERNNPVILGMTGAETGAGREESSFPFFNRALPLHNRFCFVLLLVPVTFQPLMDESRSTDICVQFAAGGGGDFYLRFLSPHTRCVSMIYDCEGNR